MVTMMWGIGAPRVTRSKGVPMDPQSLERSRGWGEEGGWGVSQPHKERMGPP